MIAQLKQAVFWGCIQNWLAGCVTLNKGLREQPRVASWSPFF